MSIDTASLQHQQGVYVNPAELIELRGEKYASLLDQLDLVQNPLPGDARSELTGHGTEFSEFRRYQPGEDIRAIDWRLSARTGKTYSRVYHEDRERQLHIVLDQRAPMFFGSRRQFKSVLAAKAAMLVAWSALDAGYRTGGSLLGSSIRRIRGQRSQVAVMQLLSAICDVNHQLSTSSQTSLTLSQGVEQGLADTRAGSSIALVSDFHDLDDAASELMLHTARRRRWLLVGIYDPLERTLPQRGVLGISDGARRSRAWMTHAISQHCSQQSSKQIERLNELATQMGTRIVWMSTTDAISKSPAHVTVPSSKKAQ
ncbi:MAG: DUF58 domain-containing protein [Gammaproteobacteria bacterium]|nr:DUF58 domain-containing protein [Gammaproteobacteria bacterium]